MNEALNRVAINLALATVRYYQCKNELEQEDTPIRQRRARNAYADMMDIQDYMAAMAREIATGKVEA